MRIAFIGPLPPLRGGIAAHSRGALDALRARGHEVHPVGFRRVYPRWLVGERPGSGRRQPDTGNHLDVYSAASWRATARYVAELAPQLVVVQYWSPVVGIALTKVLALLDGAIPSLVVCHNAVPHERIPGAKHVLRRLFRHADAALFHSRYVGDAATLLGAPDEYCVAPMPLLVGGWTGLPRPPPELAKVVDAGSRLVLVPGHLRAYKGLGNLAEAWQALDDVTAAVLVVAGEPLGARRHLRLLRRLQGSRVVILTRYLTDDELTWLLSHVAVVVLPHSSGSQSGLLPSASRLAPRVIASAVGGMGEFPAGRGDSTRVALVRPGDPAVLATALRAVLAAGPGPNRDDSGASRHDRVGFSTLERRMSWGPFVGFIESVGGRSRPARFE